MTTGLRKGSTRCKEYPHEANTREAARADRPKRGGGRAAAHADGGPVIIEEALEGEARDAPGRDCYVGGAILGAGYKVPMFDHA